MHATSRSESQPAGHDGVARGRTRGVHGEELLHVHQDARGQVLVDRCVRAHPLHRHEEGEVQRVHQVMPHIQRLLILVIVLLVMRGGGRRRGQRRHRFRGPAPDGLSGGTDQQPNNKIQLRRYELMIRLDIVHDTILDNKFNGNYTTVIEYDLKNIIILLLYS
jgi:hypothetical protein